ncbi:DUF2511 domain-containing protein [Halomonas venusta]|uniref:DUF2511 domain-containing protein n=1 Tax=Vreelandella venusta TaxID=44935 RepID=UPI00295E8CA0|nr:DUF2511 domain-containing protein [Halomonas venusta]MDW0360800.1 DUF2511 domain-containing protein [Halomonas venusta]
MSLLKPLAAIAVLAVAFLYIVGETTSSEGAKPRPDIEFSVTKDDSDQHRRRVDVLLSGRISEADLGDIAEYLVKDGATNTLIGYRIEGDSDYGYWATTNYTPDLSIRVIGTASELGTDVESQIASKDTGEISREEYGEAWPFTVDSGRLECWRGPSAVFITSGKVYQLNGMARQMGHAPLEPIWRDNPDIPGTKVNIGPMIERALRLCD